MPDRFALVGGALLDLAGSVARESLSIRLRDAARLVPTGSQIIVVQVRPIGGVERLEVVAVGRVDGADVVSVDRVGGVQLPGIRSDGHYGFLRFDGVLELVPGTAREESGRLDGLTVEILDLPFATETDQNGNFVLLAEPGAFAVVATAATTNDQERLQWETGTQLPEIIIGPEPPRVETVTVRRPRVEGDYPGPVVLLGNPAPIIDDDGVGDSIGNGDGLIDPGERIELSFAFRNDGTVEAPGGLVVLHVEGPDDVVPVSPSAITVDPLPVDLPVWVGPFVVDVSADPDPSQLRYGMVYRSDVGSRLAEHESPTSTPRRAPGRPCR